MGWSDPAWLTLAGIIIHNLHNGDTHTHTLHLFRQSCPLRMQQPPLRHTSLSHQLYATEYSRNGLRAVLRSLGPSHRNRHSYASSASRFLPFAHGPWNSLSPIPGGFRAFPLPLPQSQCYSTGSLFPVWSWIHTPLLGGEDIS